MHMAFRDNSTLIRTATKVDILANGAEGGSDVYSGVGGTVSNPTARSTAFVIADGNTGDDAIRNFGSDDSIINGKAIFDGNKDGYISFGSNNVLDVDRTSARNAGADQITVGGTGGELVTTIRYLGTKDGGFVYADASTRDQLLGHFSSGFESNNGGGDLSVQAQSRHIDNSVADDTWNFDAGSVALLTDNKLGLNFGGDTINGFGDDDLLIFTSKLYDNDNSGEVTFAKNLVLDLSGANGPKGSDPRVGPGGQLDLNAPDQQSVFFIGEKHIGETTYYYYGTENHAPVLGLDGV
jgi:hypothetical protein